jgi:hypothetical protein
MVPRAANLIWPLVMLVAIIFQPQPPSPRRGPAESFVQQNIDKGYGILNASPLTNSGARNSAPSCWL